MFAERNNHLCVGVTRRALTGGAVDGGGATAGAAVCGRAVVRRVGRRGYVCGRYGVRPERVRVGMRRWRVERRRERRCCACA
eukprot:3081758-Pleurochrysis_carterae.AAC.1